MTSPWTSARARLLGTAALGCALLLSSAQLALAQSSAQRFDVPAGDLAVALKAYALQANQQIVFSDTVGAGVNSRALAGRYTPEEALSRLLTGSDFVVTKLPNGVLRVHRQARPSEALRPERSTPVVYQGPVQRLPAAVPEAVQPEAVGEVVVTASRVARTGFTAPTPTTIVGADQIERRGPTNFAQILNEIPAFKGSYGGASPGVRLIAGVNFADLRGLSPVRTLVLVDGRRFVPEVASTNPETSYQVDLNQIPTLMIDRVEVVTGGASAQWGSDALAGVVNVILKKRINGFSATTQYGISDAGDNREWMVGFAGGRALGERAHIDVGFEYVDNDGVRPMASRDWGAREVYNLASGAAASTGLAKNVILSDVRYNNMTPGGVIVSTTGGAAASLVGQQFLPGGVLAPFPRGTIGGAGSASAAPNALLAVGGGIPGIGPSTGVPLIPAAKRGVGLVRFEYDLTSDTTLFAEAYFARNEARNTMFPSRDQGIQSLPAGVPGSNATLGFITVFSDNPYLPAAVRAQMPAGSTFRMGRADFDIGQSTSVVKNTASQFVLGAKGKVFGDWKWDAHFHHGVDTFHATAHVKDRLNFINAADAVANPATGQIVCRSTLSFPTNGCVPINLFGEQTYTAAQLAYINGDADIRTRYVQDAATVNLQGDLFNTWAGPVSLATGLEWRGETSRTTADPITQRAGLETTSIQNYSGRFSVTEGYLETVLPLAKGLRFAESIEANGALRFAHYSGASGNQTSWKFGATWRPGGGLLFRGAQSRDIRAPNILESRLNSLTQVLVVAATRPLGNGTTLAIPVDVAGNPNLTPEKADTTTLGVSYQPTFLPRLRLSADHYRININNVIVQFGQQPIVDACAAGNADFCKYVQVVGGVITRVLNPYFNAAQLQQVGWEFAASYRTPIPASLGDLDLTFSAANVQHVRYTVQGSKVRELAGQNGPSPTFHMPSWRWTGSATWTGKRASLTGQVSFISKGKYLVTNADGTATTDPSTAPAGVQPDYNDNSIPAVAYVNLSGSWNISRNGALQLFGVVNNLFNVDPPYAPSAALGQSTNTQLYDVIGRSFRIGMRFKH